MAGNVINFAVKRAELAARRQRQREEAFDRELRRRLAAFLDEQPIPAEPIADNPYR